MVIPFLRLSLQDLELQPMIHKNKLVFYESSAAFYQSVTVAQVPVGIKFCISSGKLTNVALRPNLY